MISAEMHIFMFPHRNVTLTTAKVMFDAHMTMTLSLRSLYAFIAVLLTRAMIA